MKKLFVASIAIGLFACTNDMTTQHPNVEPLQWRGQLSDPDTDHGFGWASQYTDASMADPYLHSPIDMDSGVRPHDAALDHWNESDAAPEAASNGTPSNQFGKQACYWYSLFSGNYSQNAETCAYGWSCFSEVLSDQCMKVSKEHMGDSSWRDYVNGTCQPCYVDGTL